MTKERGAELAEPFLKAEKLQTKKELESKILKPIYKKIQIILREKSLKKLESLSANLAKRLNA